MSEPVIAVLLTLAGAVVSFFVGAIPFGVLVGRLLFQTDIRAHGSGNIGAMNAVRTMGLKGGIAVLLLDAAKGFFCTWFVTALVFVGLFWFSNESLKPGLADVLMGPTPRIAALFALAAVFGHCFSPFLRFKGGKGVATAFGALLAMSPLALLLCLVVWVLGALVFTRYSSVGSMAANLFAPVALWWCTGQPFFIAYGVIAGLLIVWTHRENIARLASGTENRINLKRS